MSKTGKIPEIEVGVVSSGTITFVLNGTFIESSSGELFDRELTARCNGRKILLKNVTSEKVYSDTVILSPVPGTDSSFTLKAVMIGVGFHWQRNEDQVFKGILKFISDRDKLTAVNVLSIEDYLISVISSEMSAKSSDELLKAHAVVSRSWLICQVEKSRRKAGLSAVFNSHTVTGDEIVRWYDWEDHANFDVCADDHCQRYQGITRACTPAVERAINATSGEVLIYEGMVCDSRYYKCCGGITELFENVWEPVNHPYLQKVIDNPVPPAGFDLSIDKEESVRKWISGEPEAFCNTSDIKVLNQVLNDYDQETNDFYRWKVSYKAGELSEIVRSRTGIDFGIITDLLPLERGVSGRIKRLKVEGSKRTMIIGKELEIRKALSRSHLYSSCFIVNKITEGSEVRFELIGAGWGHGVGLCQIGAAVMGSKGYTYREILNHYFKNALIEKRY